MEKVTKKAYISFDWDLFDSSTSKSEDSKTSYGFSFSDLSDEDNYDPSVIYNKLQDERQKGNSYSSTTTRAVTKVSDETETVVTKKKSKKRRRGKKKEVQPDPNEEVKTERPDTETCVTEADPAKTAKKKKYKNKYSKTWREKYEKFYKNKKKFILDLIREEEGPFLFKLQLQYHHRKGKSKSSGKFLNF